VLTGLVHDPQLQRRPYRQLHRDQLASAKARAFAEIQLRAEDVHARGSGADLNDATWMDDETDKSSRPLRRRRDSEIDTEEAEVLTVDEAFNRGW
jgi:hypothetical protein